MRETEGGEPRPQSTSKHPLKLELSLASPHCPNSSHLLHLLLFSLHPSPLSELKLKKIPFPFKGLHSPVLMH